MIVRAFIQARMRSHRFPGKVLAPLLEKPIIAHVVDQVSSVVSHDKITIATSRDPSDDPIDQWCARNNVHCYRGPLADVFSRFKGCLSTYPCDWFFRVCGDSPLLNPETFQEALTQVLNGTPDIVTTIYPRTFPSGQNVELIRATTFNAVDSTRLSDKELEHVTQFFYTHPDQFTIINLSTPSNVDREKNFAVDTVEDLERIKAILKAR